MSAETKREKKDTLFPHPFIRDQEGATCYANAVTTITHLAMLRVVNRQGGVPSMNDLCRSIVNDYGKQGGCGWEVLGSLCPILRLQYEKIGATRALHALKQGRPVLGSFYLSETKWERFSTFFENESTKKGILTQKDLGWNKKDDEEYEGHEVVIIEMNEHYIQCLNSWGEDWGDKGTFRVKANALCWKNFHDVFWTNEDLLPCEKKSYNIQAEKLHIRNVAKSWKTNVYCCENCMKVDKQVVECNVKFLFYRMFLG